MNDEYELTKYNSRVSFLSASDALSLHMNNKDIFSHDILSIREAIGVNIEEDFSTKNRRQSHYLDCTVIHSNLESSGFLGSSFRRTDFIDCNFTYGNFHSCIFDEVTISFTGSENTMSSAGFHKSVFTQTIFENIKFFSCGFTDALFVNCIFRNCIIRLCSMEGAEFRNCKFIDTKMGTQNLEYVQFDNTTWDNVILPFAPLPYLYSGLTNILNSDNVYIYSASASENKLTARQYSDLLKNFIIYHKEVNNYFPVACLYINSGMHERAFEAVISGILYSLGNKDFRMLRHFVKLVYIHDIFTKEMRLELLGKISSWSEIQNLDVGEKYTFDAHFSQIRQMLIYDDYNKPSLRITIKTNVEMRDELQTLMNVINDMLPPHTAKCNHFIELRHNSPVAIDVVLVCQDLFEIFKLITICYAYLKGINKFVDIIASTVTSVQDAVLKSDQHKLNNNELALADLIRREKQLQLEKQQLEIKKLQAEIDIIDSKAQTSLQLLSSSKICIHSIEHIVSNTPYIINSQFLEYKAR